MNWIIILLCSTICGLIAAIIMQEQRVKRIESQRNYWVKAFIDASTNLLKLAHAFAAIGGDVNTIKEIVNGKDSKDN